MPGPGGAIFHVTVRGVERRRLFDDDADRERFLLRMDEAVEEDGVTGHLVQGRSGAEPVQGDPKDRRVDPKDRQRPGGREAETPPAAHHAGMSLATRRPVVRIGVSVRASASRR